MPRDEDDIFGSPPPQIIRASPQLRTSGKEALHLVDGPFRSAYTNANGNGKFRPMVHDRCPSGTDEEAEADGEYEEWPPRRGKQKSLSSSRDKLSPNIKRRLSTHDFIQAKSPASATSHNRILFPAASAHEFPLPVTGSPSKHSSLGHYRNSAALNGPSVNDPFRLPPVNREARRWTLAGDSKIPRVDTSGEDRRASVQHIDLRALHSGKSVGSSQISGAMSICRSNTSESSSVAKKKGPRKPSRSSTPPNLSASNKVLVLALGLEAVYSRMAKNHKFHIDVVREVATRQRSLEDADRVLRNMREAAGREYARLLRQDETVRSPVGRETGESEQEDEDNADRPRDKEGDSEPVRPSRLSLGSNHSPRSLVPHGRAKRLALKITTASPDSSPMHAPDYSPPTPTRAHVFLRLEREGRVEEARLREARRVRRSLRPSSAEASPETDEQRILTYLLQLQEDDKDEDPLEKPQNTSRPERLYEDAETAQVEEQVDADDEDDDGQTSYGLQATGPEEPHVDSTGVDDVVTAANEQQTTLRNVLTEDIGHNGFPLDMEYAAKATSSLAVLATVSVLDIEWTNSDDELLLDGDLITHEELVRRKGLGSVKFRTAHLYSLLLDG